ncbi:MAG: hypothetical protein LBU94_01500 [Clostridiales bacterium]|jgi:hypothetical protein|nr:hypothetical protein [Clostridiales bacterium]
MRYDFTPSDKDEGINTAELEDLFFTGEYVEDIPSLNGSGNNIYRSFGQAVVEGETYSEFMIEFTLENPPASLTARDIFEADWIEYDYVFND